MALFGSKKKEEKKEAAAPAVKTVRASKTKAVKAAPVTSIANPPALSSEKVSGAAGVIIRPHVTEKSGLMSHTGVYTFQVTKNANKQSVAAAIKSLYKVTPHKVSIVNLPSRNVFVRGRAGLVSGVRKALVTLKKGETIDFV